MGGRILFRRLVLFGAPIFVGLVLLFHPIGGMPEQGKPVDVFGFIAPVADRFVLVHVLFAPGLGLLGLAMYLLLEGMRGRAATVSRVATGVFVVFYILYESIVGAATGNLVRTSLNLPPAQQAVVAQVASRLWTDPLLGDFPALIPVIAFIGWVTALVAGAIALRRAGAPILACLLLVLSSGLTLHASPSGPIGMLSFLLAALWLDRIGAKVVRSAPLPSPAGQIE